MRWLALGLLAVPLTMVFSIALAAPTSGAILTEPETLDVIKGGDGNCFQALGTQTPICGICRTLGSSSLQCDSTGSMTGCVVFESEGECRACSAESFDCGGQDWHYSGNIECEGTPEPWGDCPTFLKYTELTISECPPGMTCP